MTMAGKHTRAGDLRSALEEVTAGAARPVVIEVLHSAATDLEADIDRLNREAGMQ